MWWGPIAIIGAALLGVGIGFALLGRRDSAGARRRSHGGVAYEEAPNTSELRVNPWPILVLGGIVAIIVALAVGLSVD
jgi:hypothetical protein